MAIVRGTRTNRTLIWLTSFLLVCAVFFIARRLTRTTLEVRAFTVERGNITTPLATNGKVQPMANYEEHAPFAAAITTLNVHEGDHVHKGELLLALDDVNARARLATAVAALDGAKQSSQSLSRGGTQEERLTLSGDLARQQAELESAKASLATLQKLEAQGAAAPGEVRSAQARVANDQSALQSTEQRKTSRYDQGDLSHAQATVADAEAQVAAARQAVDQATVHSPIDGTVYSLSAAKTQFVQQGDRLMQIADLTKMQIVAYFDEPDIGKLSIGEPVSITWTAHPEKTWHGHISRLPSTVQAYTTRNVGQAWCTIDDATGDLLPDTNVNVTVTVAHVGGAIFVPREAIHTEGGLTYAYRITRTGILKRTRVQLGTFNLTQSQILSGLATGDNVALGSTNLQPLVDGAAVKIVP